MTQRNPDRCDPDIEQRGTVFHVFEPMTNEEANELCQKIEDANPMWRVDWHRARGRIVIKYLEKENDTPHHH